MAVEELKASQAQDLNGADALNVSGPSRNQKKGKGGDSNLGTLVSPSISRQSLAESVEVAADPSEPAVSDSGPASDPESKTVLDDVADGLHGLFISVADGIKNMEKKILDMLGGGEIDPAQIIRPIEQPKVKKKRKKLGDGDSEEEFELPVDPPLP